VKLAVPTLLRPIVTAVLGTALLIWGLLTTWSAIAAEREHHATLAAASSALRPGLGDAASRDVPARLAALAGTLATWELTAAAFDRNGTFLGGDPRLRSDGLPAGRDAAPPTGRQTAIVPTRDGYVILVRDPRAIVRFREMLALQLFAALVIAFAFALFFGLGWARARAASIAQARDDFRAIAAGENRPPASFTNDPVFGEVVLAAKDALERLVRALGDRAESEERLRAFLADAGHELRTPLAIAVGYLGILRRGGYGDAALVERIASDVSLEHERLVRLVERILHLARLDAVPGDAGASSDVARVAREAVALVRPLDVDRAIAIGDDPHALAAIGADDLRDALRNLLENAIRHAPDSAISVTIETDGDEIVIWVRDAGPGMDAFTAAHAFDRFFRGPDRGEVSGTGLGLAIVRRIVERAGGRVRLESAAGMGTAVEVRLPRADRVPIASP
jgi:two-component system OmpR family sensor kinase